MAIEGWSPIINWVCIVAKREAGLRCAYDHMSEYRAEYRAEYSVLRESGELSSSFPSRNVSTFVIKQMSFASGIYLDYIRPTRLVGRR